MSPLYKRSKLAIFLFLAPTVILFTMIIVIPVFQSAAMSFTKWDGVNEATFCGLDNYKKLFHSRDLKVAIRNSLIYSVILTTYQVGLATLFSFFLVNYQLKGTNMFRDLYYFPVLLSVSVVAQLWISIYHGDFGLINQMAKASGSDWLQNWLNQPIKGIAAIAIADSWKGMGYHMLIIYAAMRNVPKTYYEAAVIDGASPARQFWNITLPLTAPTIRVCFVMCITFGFRVFEMIFLMTAGGPGNQSTTMSVMLYKALFRMMEYGYSSAIAVVIVVVCVSLMLIINRATRNLEVEF